uniref:Uncharacterized protein n=1 Tax=Candidozyma auris TaxID=498019 RepID=A0A0L0P7I6_CANAR
MLLVPTRRLLVQPKPHLRLSHAWIHNTPALGLFGKKAAQTQPKNQNQVDHQAFDKHPILSKVPRILRPWTTQFIHAPVSHVTAFLILHELTAIVPLVGIWYLLHSYHDLLMVSSLDLPSWAIEKGTKIIDLAMVSFDWGNYSLNEKVQIIMEGAYAYVIVKALFPVRLAFSLLGMPWFAKWFVLPFTRMFSRRKAAKTVPVEQQKLVPPTPTATHEVKKVDKPRL